MPKPNQYHFRLNKHDGRFLDKIIEESGYKTKQEFLSDLALKFAPIHKLKRFHIAQTEKSAEILDLEPEKSLGALIDGHHQILMSIHKDKRTPLLVYAFLFILKRIEKKKLIRFIDPKTGERI